MRQCFIDHEVQITGSMVSAGYAVDNKKILILNENDQEVDEHQVGEIAVKSRYLSPGYWRRADLTSAAFPPIRQEETHTSTARETWGAYCLMAASCISGERNFGSESAVRELNWRRSRLCWVSILPSERL